MASSNLPIPAGPRAPITPAWFFTTAPPAAIVWLYRTLIAPEKRRGWNNGVSTSHEAMAAILAPGGGWRAFRQYATPQLKVKHQPGFVAAWALFVLALAIPSLSIAKQQSWAN